MASTYSPLLRFELIGSGDQAGLWGTTTNGNLGALVEQSVAGVASIVLSSSADYTLQSLNGTPDEARCAVLNFSGAPGGATNIIIPASQKLYVVRNSTGQTLTVKTAAQVGGVTILDANATLVFCNGINALPGIQSSSTANVTGPGSSTANAIARYNGTTGQLLKNSAAIIDDNGASSFVGTVTVGAQSSSVGGQVSLRESSAQGTNTIALRAPASLASDVTLTLPDSAGSASQVLTTNGSGTLSWTSPGAVTSVNGLTGAVTVTPSLIGAPSTNGTGASGTWGINISGSAGSATYATYDSSGYGIVNTGTNQTIGGTKTFTGSSNFGGPATYINIYGQLQCITASAGAAFGTATPNGTYACYIEGPSGSSGGLVTQTNSFTVGATMGSSNTGIAIIQFNYGTLGVATNVGSIGTNGTGTGYNTASDYRLKQDIGPLTDAVARVKLLKPCDFTWKSAPEEGVVEGFIAHELQEVVPNAVFGNKDAVDKDGNPAYQGVDASFLIPMLTAALQEALARIEALEAKVG